MCYAVKNIIKLFWSQFMLRIGNSGNADVIGHFLKMIRMMLVSAVFRKFVICFGLLQDNSNTIYYIVGKNKINLHCEPGQNKVINKTNILLP